MDNNEYMVAEISKDELYDIIKYYDKVFTTLSNKLDYIQILVEDLMERED